MIAFDQSPLAIEYFPEKWKTPDICRSAFERDATAIIFFPPDCASPSMVEGWLEHLTNPEVRRWQVRSRRNIEFLRSIDVEWLRLRRIGALLRELGLRRTLSAAWSPGDEAFHVLESISSEDDGAISYYQDLPAPTIELESQPKDLDELTELLDGDLSDVDFGSYQFADYDPTRHDLSSAHVPVATLKRIGAYDGSSFMRLVGDVPEFAMMGPSKDGEIVPAVEARLLQIRDYWKDKMFIYKSTPFPGYEAYAELFETGMLITRWVQDVIELGSLVHIGSPFGNGLYDTVIFENAQGLMLSEDLGEHTTSSVTGAQAIADIVTAEKLCDLKDVRLRYVSRTYSTRHGDGPLPMECPQELLHTEMVDKTNVWNQWQGNLRYGLIHPDMLFRHVTDDIAKAGMATYNTTVVMTHVNEVPYRMSLQLPVTEVDNPYMTEDHGIV